MAFALTIRNRQKTRVLNARLLRRIMRALLEELPRLSDADLGLLVVAAPEMTRLNETFLRHAGSTDVITFDYREAAEVAPSSRGLRPAGAVELALHGEIIVCVDEAILQARRFRTSWPVELVRYLVHGVLHLRGFDDQTPAARLRMKREENRLLRRLAGRFPLSRLARSR